MLPPLPRCSGRAHSSLKLAHPYHPSPKPLSGRPAHRPFRGLLGVHSRCGLHTRAVTKIVTVIRRLQTFRRLHACSGCFRLERSPGGPCTHWKSAALSRRTWLADLWLFVTPTKGRAVCAQPHFCVTAVRAILKNLRWRYWSMAKLVFGMSQSVDGYVDHLEMQPGFVHDPHSTE